MGFCRVIRAFWDVHPGHPEGPAHFGRLKDLTWTICVSNLSPTIQMEYDGAVSESNEVTRCRFD
jgi:hypothetical protein